MSSSSDDDDIPLSALAKNGGSKRSRPDDDDSEEAEFDDEASAHEPADEEEDIDEFIVDDEDEDDEDGDYASDDSDDIPLSALKSPPKKKAKPVAKSKAKAKATKKAAPKKKATTATKKKKSTSTSAKKSSAKSASAAPSNYVSASTELYANCEKGKLIQSLLARWWYVYDWPGHVSPPPKGYDELDGFPGVYICTSGVNIGDLKDVRDKTKAPSFQNYYKKSSEELRDDLLKAIEKQKAALIKAEGEGTSTEKELRALEKWATKLNCSKADKDAAKVLKAARLPV